MAVVYFDTSALVKLVVDEPGTDLAAELWDAPDRAYASRLAYVELCAALAALRRAHRLTTAELGIALRGADAIWGDVRPVRLEEPVASDGGQLAIQHALKGADAVHLASAVALRDPYLIFATWDRRLHRAARAAGLRVAPAVLPT